MRLKSNVAEKKNMHLNTCIKKESREYPEFMTITTASLSKLGLTVVPFHCIPKRAQAIAIGASSLIAICSCCMACGH